MRKKIGIYITLFLLSIGVYAQQLAFPGAEGYGRFATGGRGGLVVEVTNLEDNTSNPPVGSLRWAFNQGVETENHPILGPREIKRPITVVFKVGGVIELKGDLRVKRDFMTIAGQTAPGDGICISGATVNFGGSNNLIVRYIRFRPGDLMNLETSALRIENGSNFIIDHCTMSWGIEEVTHFSSNKNSTVQWCIISESLYNSIHKKGLRGYATQWGGEYASYHHNLLAHHNSRMPRINGSNKNDIESLVDYRNNVNYNWGSAGAFYGGEWEETNGKGFSHVNVVNNYLKSGPALTNPNTFARPSYKRSGTRVDGYAKWYVAGNVLEGNESRTNDNWLGIDGSEVGGIANIRYDIEHVKTDGVLEAYQNYTQTAAEAYQAVLEKAGAILPKRDAHDTRLIAEIKGEIPIVRYEVIMEDGQKTPAKGLASGLIDTPRNLVDPNAAPGTTAWTVYSTTTADQAPVDTDKDGIPDAWEIANGLNPNDAADGKIIGLSGYSNLEIYLADLTGIKVGVTSKKAVNTLKVFPNPTDGIFMIQTTQQNAKVEIFDLLGAKIKETNIEGLLSQIDLSEYRNGHYIARATFENGEIFTAKVIKK